jgi:hypothetical protein
MFDAALASMCVLAETCGNALALEHTAISTMKMMADLLNHGRYADEVMALLK